jgi:hypothetical protein
MMNPTERALLAAELFASRYGIDAALVARIVEPMSRRSALSTCVAKPRSSGAA